MTQEELAERLDMREVFVMPKELHGLHGRTFIPAFFADKRFDSRVLYAVSGSLGTCTGAQKFRFFTMPCEQLEHRSARDLIELEELSPLPDAVKVFRSSVRKR